MAKQLSVGSAAFNNADNRALENDTNPVRKTHDLVQIL
jgi:hypothetical protein